MEHSDTQKEKSFFIRCRAVILHEGKILVVRHTHSVEFYSLPGGHLEWGEDPLTCIAREVEEELGIRPEIGRLLYVHTLNSGDRHNLEFFFEIKNAKDYLTADFSAATHAHEIGELHWMSPEDTHKLLPEEFARDFREQAISSLDIKYIGASF